MPKKINTQSFIIKAIKIHGDKYDYSHVIYSTWDTKIKIKCKEHGIFEQIPNSHIRGSGCPKCGVQSSTKRRTGNLSKFKYEAKKVHGNKYNYDNAIFKSARTKLEIICPEHGIFLQTPISHINKKSGCPKCANIKCSVNLRMDLLSYISKCNKIHNNKYDYSSVSYHNLKENIDIICPEHGIFSQIAESHLRGSGCPKCSGNSKLMSDTVVTRLKDIHPEYNNDGIIFNGLNNLIKLECPAHGTFEALASNVLFKKSGCPSCAKTGFNPEKPAVLYYILDKETGLYKIGVTNLTLQKRFGKIFCSKRAIALMEQHFENGYDAYLAEQEILTAFSHKRCTNEDWPETKGGKTEFFTENVLNLTEDIST